MRSLSFILLVLGGISRATLAGEPEILTHYKAVREEIKKAETLLQKAPLDDAGKKDLAAAAEVGMTRIGDTIDSLKKQIDLTLKSVHGTKVVPPNAEPTFPFAMDGNTASLLRAYALQGNYGPVATVFDLSALNVRLVGDWLMLAQAAAVAKGRTRLPYGDYLLVRTQLLNAVDGFHRFFPNFEEIPAAQPTKEGALSVDLKSLEVFVTQFSAPGETLPEAGRNLVLNGIASISITTALVESYHRLYPQRNNDAALQHVSVALTEIPGLHECINLSRGLGDFEGEPCRPAEFKKGLRDYIDFYEKNGGAQSGLLSTVLEFFVSFKDTEGANAADAKFTELKNDLDWHVTNAKFHAVIKQKWPAVRDEIFGDTKKLRELLTKGESLHAFLNGILSRNAVQPRLGFDGDYFENVEGAKAVLQRFEEQKLDQAPDQFARVTNETSCKVFLDGDTARAPWTVNTLVSTESTARSETSASGFERLIWGAEVKAGNAVSIQNSQIPDKMLAGVASRTALTLIVPNIVHTRLLLGKSAGDSLADLGINPSVNEPMATAERHFRMPSWKLVIASAAGAFEGMVRQHVESVGEADAWNTVEGRPKLIEGYRAKFRNDQAEGATQLREVAEWLRKVKEEAHKMADPAIATVLQIPTDFTGEFNKREAASINHSLIHTFLPYVIQDYIKRKWPAAKTDRNVMAAKYKELKSSFTIDQFMEQLDWYWGLDVIAEVEKEIPGWGDFLKGKPRTQRLPDAPLRRPDFIGVEELRLLWNYPVIAARMLNHVMDAYQRKIDYLDYAQKRLYYQFPALALDDAWKTYDDTKFDVVLGRYLANAVREANQVVGLMRTKAALDYFMPNAPLWDAVLRRHPDQKLALCKEQKDRKIWDERKDAVLTATMAVATAAAYVPVLAPVAIVVDGVVLFIQAVESYEKYKEARRTEAFLYSAASQMEAASVEEARYVVRELEGVFAISVAKVAIQTAMVGPAVALRMPPIGKLPGMLMRTPRALWRAAKVLRSEYRAARALEEAAAKAARVEGGSVWFANSSGRLARSLRFLDGLRHKMMLPFTKLGLAQRWTHKTLYQRFYPNLAFGKAHRVAWNAGGVAKDVFLNFPWSVMGYSWGSGILAKTFQFYSLYEMSMWTIHATQNVQDATTELVMERVHQDPESYKDLVDGMYDGTYRHSDLVTMIQLDDKLGAIYREKSHALIGEYAKAATRDERDAAIGNLKGMDAELEKSLKAELAKPGFDPNKVRVLRRTRRQLDSTLKSLQFFAK